MAETITQHQYANVATPANGDPLDATVVRNNINNVGATYNTHDSDPGIHVQSSAAGSRPAAGTAGRKWISTATVAGASVATLAYDNGSAWLTDTTFHSTAAVQNGQPGIYDAGNSGTSLAINWANSPIQKVTMTGNCTFTFSNAIAGGTYTLILVQNGTGGYSPTLTGFDFGDNAPVYNTGANKKNVVSALYDGTEYLAAFSVKGA
ncbi:MAG: hypothetical protein RL328_136 [Acidobacteriota bacterium]|jgi:hypothetical protein